MKATSYMRLSSVNYVIENTIASFNASCTICPISLKLFAYISYKMEKSKAVLCIENNCNEKNTINI